MRLLVLGLAVAALVVGAALAGGEVLDGLRSPQTTNSGPDHHELTLTVEAVTCDTYADGVCLAYDGQVPGPTLIVRKGDTLNVTIVNRIDETLATLDVPNETRQELSNASVSLHTHGVDVPADEDGVSALADTQMVDSFVRPGESFTHHYTALHAGTWHYHDHVMGMEGHEGQMRGLYGTLIVLERPAPTPDHVLDLHLLDNGPNNGRGLSEALPAGDSFEFVVVGLGNQLWQVALEHPDGTRETTETGPGVSHRFSVASAEPGTYTWTAFNAFTFQESTGQVVVS